MKKSQIKKITKYLIKTPDKFESQIINFIGYLAYINNIDSEFPYPDEKKSIDNYKKIKNIKKFL